MEGSQHVKSLSTDARGNNRLKFISNKQKSKRASADVYRSYQRKIGVTSAASREERVHHPHQDETKKKRRRTNNNNRGDDKVAVLHNSQKLDLAESSEDDLDSESTFENELDLARDRNSSEIFESFYKEIWHLVRSLPEILHHSNQVVDILLTYLLSPESAPSTKSPIQEERNAMTEHRQHYLCNHATTDILHLLAVLARDLRHEIHPHVEHSILPRIIMDLLTPPPFSPESGKQPTPLDVSIVEAAFRTISYILRYDAEPLLAHVEKHGHEPCLEQLRPFYGATLGHKRDLVRRLAAETFAPLIRKLRSDVARKKHLKRVIRALASSITANPTRSLLRAQQDARDGIASLLFQITRGVAGRLHSKAQAVVKIALDTMAGYAEKDGSKTAECDVVFHVNVEFMAMMIYHIHPGHFCLVWKELVSCAEFLILKSKGESSAMCMLGLEHVLQLMTKCIASRQGHAFVDFEKHQDSEDAFLSILSILNRLMILSTFHQLSDLVQYATLDLLCALWKRNPSQADIASKIGARLSSILGKRHDQDLAEKVATRCARKLSQDLLPYLPSNIAMSCVGSAILSAAGKLASSVPDDALYLVFAVASSRSSQESDTDNVIDVSNAGLCDVTTACKESLLNICLTGTTEFNLGNPEYFARISYAARCIPFLERIKPSDETTSSPKSTKNVLKWLVLTLEQLCAKISGSGTVDQDALVSASLVLEALATTASVCITNSQVSSSWLDIQVKNATRIGNRLLSCEPSSLLVVKAMAALVHVLRNLKSLPFNQDENKTFDVLNSNLRSRNHFLRLHTLTILSSFPCRSYVTLHAELDLRDDLDDEPALRSQGSTMDRIPVSGVCDIMETLLQIETTQMSLQNERTVSSMLGRIEVLAKTKKLPAAYAEAVANHMLGLLHFKFAPVWPSAVRVLVALASCHDEMLWQPYSISLKEIMIPCTLEDCNIILSVDEETINVMECVHHHQALRRWNESQGDDYQLFKAQVIAAKEEGRVSLHLSTDESTRFEYILAVLEGAPELTAKKSRHIVPIFLDFMHSQYYFYNSFDPDARELCLQNHLEKETR